MKCSWPLPGVIVMTEFSQIFVCPSHLSLGKEGGLQACLFTSLHFMWSNARRHGLLKDMGHQSLLLRSLVPFTSAKMAVFLKSYRSSLLAGLALNHPRYWIEVCCYFRDSGKKWNFKSLRLYVPSASGCSPQHSCDMSVMLCLEHLLWWGPHYLQR